jgi:mannosyltransferase OCH1-like enzyme
MITLLNKKRNQQKMRNFQKMRQKLKEIKEKREKIQKENEIIKKYNQLYKPFPLQSSYNSIIPLHLYTCWHTKDLPPLMRKNYDFTVESNPKITFHLYDEEDCRQFIQKNFDSDVLNAYNSLIPCSYKSDLWRFCVLYINGGIYMDIKYRCVNGFKFIALTEKEHFVRDRYNIFVCTALIVTLPKNEIMLKCINQIVENVKNKFYGDNALEPTGPSLLCKFFTQQEVNNMNFSFKDTNSETISEYYIVQEDRIILKEYKGYRDEQKQVQKNKYYADLWNEKNIYYN